MRQWVMQGHACINPDAFEVDSDVGTKDEFAELVSFLDALEPNAILVPLASKSQQNADGWTAPEHFYEYDPAMIRRRGRTPDQVASSSCDNAPAAVMYSDEEMAAHRPEEV